MSSLHFRAHCWLPFLAVVFCLGSFTAKAQDEPSAEKIAEWRKAAERGDAGAQRLLGTCYFHGLGVAKDEVESAKWFRKGAEQGDAKAQLRLGLCYAKSEGVAKDEVEAAKWYRKAAEQGYADAQYILGFCCDKGSGVVEDKVEAYKWLNLAAAFGDKDAAELRESTAKVMTPDQIAAAQRLSREWKPNK